MATSNLVTFGGYAVLIVIAGVLYKVYIDAKPKSRVTAPKGGNRYIEPKSIKPKKTRKDSSVSSGDQDIKAGVKTQKKKQPQASKPVEEVKSFSQVADRDDEVDNREFARQLSSVKSGTVVAPKSQTASKQQKSVKQSRAQEKVPVETSSDNATAPSSATGGDADDDQSPLNSPKLSATSVLSTITNGVSDMLEKVAPGPSVLKITESNTPSRPKKVQSNTFEAVETKKQRQNRKKAEQSKLAREEEEKERQKKMNEQRRTARVAEGRAAKDGSTFMAAKAPTGSAWAGPTGTETNGSQATNSNVELLDTYEPSKAAAAIPPVDKKVTTVPAEALNSGSDKNESDWQNHFSTLPSEEEQTRQAIEESENWKTVKTKEKRKAAKAAPKEETQGTINEPNDYGVPAVIAPTGPGKKWTANLVHVESAPKEVVEREVELQDSEWEVA
ncbi:hypothetical protein LSUE1_G000866 [Lachnellula suecica]|uniref:Uncharacterized protein n=1 Tax=Lachnellula suecica TaxID=602035 RepID=A0A8T9CHF8_9HELO|nr:hypothetical protein LSUE1_G000866 [Lachnellula suecica]